MDGLRMSALSSSTAVDAQTQPALQQCAQAEQQPWDGLLSARLRGVQEGGVEVEGAGRDRAPAEGLLGPPAPSLAVGAGAVGVADGVGQGGGEVSDVALGVERGAGAVGGLLDGDQPARLAVDDDLGDAA